MLNYQNLPKVRAWGLEVNTNLMQIDARVLNAPAVSYKGGKTILAQGG